MRIIRDDLHCGAVGAIGEQLEQFLAGRAVRKRAEPDFKAPFGGVRRGHLQPLRIPSGDAHGVVAPTAVSLLGFLGLLGGLGFGEVGREPNQLLLDRVSAVAPSVEPALERVDAGDPAVSEEQRHTGAGGFAGSSAVEDNFPVARDLLVAQLDLLGVHAQGARQLRFIRLEFDGTPEIDYHDVFAGVELALELGRGDARDAQIAHEAPALDVLPHQIAGERAH